MAGWVKIHRKLKDHWLWQDAEKLRWWLDILLEVNHEDRKVLLKGTLVECKRGQCVRSLETWAKEWRTTKKTVRGFLILLQKDEMILLESVTVSTRLTICNYESYQDRGNAKETQSKRRVNGKETQPTPKQEGKELEEGEEVLSAVADEKEKAQFKAFQDWIKENAPRVNEMKEPITFEQWQKATAEFGKIGYMLKKMHNYKPLLQKNLSTYLTLCNWIRKEQEAA